MYFIALLLLYSVMLLGCSSEEIVVPPTNNLEEEEINPDEELLASSQINAPFPLGVPLSVLKEYYGEPSYDDYYSGGRTVVFDKEGYIIDEIDETVRGYYFGKPTLSVFGANVGMTAEEINKVLSASAEPEENMESDGYLLAYYKNGYKIFFYLENKNGPTTSVMLMRE